MEQTHVRIRTHDGVPVRDSIEFATGKLFPGEVLAIPSGQAKRAKRQGLVDFVTVEQQVADGVTVKPPASKKKKKRAAKPAPAPETPAVTTPDDTNVDPLT
jgi:hypothetical protein